MGVIYTLWCMTAICYGLLKGQLETFWNLGQLRWLHYWERLLTVRSPAISVCVTRPSWPPYQRFQFALGGSPQRGWRCIGPDSSTALISAHSRLPERNDAASSCIAGFCSQGRSAAVSCSCTHTQEGRRSSKLKPASKLLHFHLHALTYQMQGDLDVSAQRCRMIKSAVL